MKNNFKNKRKRRQLKQFLKFGAKTKHKLKTGRTGSVHSKKLQSRRTKKSKLIEEDALQQLLEIIEEHLSKLTPIQRKQAEKRFNKYMEKFEGH